MLISTITVTSQVMIIERSWMYSLLKTSIAKTLMARLGSVVNLV